MDTYTESILQRAFESNSEFSREVNIVFSEDDIYCNFWPFENNACHYCFVIGFSGSGKSTLAKKLAKKYNATWSELDVIIYDAMNHKLTDRFLSSQKQPLLSKYLKNTKTDISYMQSMKDQLTDTESRVKIIETGKKYVDWLTTVNKDRCIISGIDLIDILPMNPKWYGDPIIFKGTSMLTSFVRRILRNKKHISLSQIPEIFKWYKSDAHGINYLRSTIITRYNAQTREEPDINKMDRSYSRA